MRKAECCKNQVQDCLDATLDTLHSKKCMMEEISWLKVNITPTPWNGIMSWKDRILELENAIAKENARG